MTATVKTPAVPAAVVEAVRAARTVLLLTHARPDGDGIGSTLALRIAFQKLGKEVSLANRDPFPRNYSFLHGADTVVVTPRVEGRWDLAIVCDAGDPAQLSGIIDFPSQAGQVLCLDHHDRRVPFGGLEYIVEDAAATGEVAYDLIRALGVSVDASMAACLYVALLTDTGSFQYSCTTPRTLQLAAELIATGIPFPEICERVFHTYTAAQVKLWGQTLSSLGVTANGKIATVRLTREQMLASGSAATSTEGFINPVRAIETVEVAAFFCEMGPAETKLSMRSRGAVDVAELAATFGGGGHQKASGCTLRLPLEEAERVALARIGEFLRRAGVA